MFFQSPQHHDSAMNVSSILLRIHTPTGTDSDVATGQPRQRNRLLGAQALCIFGEGTHRLGLSESCPVPQTLSHTFARSLVSSRATQNASWRIADNLFGRSKEMLGDECLPARLSEILVSCHHPLTYFASLVLDVVFFFSTWHCHTITLRWLIGLSAQSSDDVVHISWKVLTSAPWRPSRGVFRLDASCGSSSVTLVSLSSSVLPTCSASPILCLWLGFADWTWDDVVWYVWFGLRGCPDVVRKLAETAWSWRCRREALGFQRPRRKGAGGRTRTVTTRGRRRRSGWKKRRRRTEQNKPGSGAGKGSRTPT